MTRMYLTEELHSLKSIAQEDNAVGFNNLNISKYVISAICGCWWRESNCNPAIWESLIPCAWDYEYEYTHKGGYGLGQWTNVGTSHGRLYNLHTWVTNNGYSDGDGYGQLEFMLHENHWATNNPSRLHYSNLTQFLESSSTNTDDLVYDFLSQWEGVPNDHYSERCGYARTILSYLEQHGGESASWITGNRYLSQAQILNNALVIYNYVGGGEPSGTYHVYCSSTGNGTCYAIPSSHYGTEFETFTVYAIPYGEDVLENITAHEAHGTSVAVTVAEQHTYQASSFPFDVWFEATFSGETPPPPPPPTRETRHKMPIWMYPILRI